MDTLEAILTRHSTRNFLDKPVDESVIRELLRAAMNAPSANDEQPWHFVIVDDEDLLRRVFEFHYGAAAANSCPVGILLCHEPAREVSNGFWIQDMAAATENLLLAAHNRGLGANWLGSYPIEEFMDGFRDLVSLPENLLPFSFVALGHPAEEKAGIRDTFQEDRIHRLSEWNPS